MEITKVKPECHRKMLLFVVIITIRIKTLPGPTQNTLTDRLPGANCSSVAGRRARHFHLKVNAIEGSV